MFDEFCEILKLDQEAFSIILACFCFVGAWMTVRCLVKWLYSLLWPLFFISLILYLNPMLREKLVTEIVPRQIQHLKCMATQYINQLNTTWIFN